jgi:hypothetical protein
MTGLAESARKNVSGSRVAIHYSRPSGEPCRREGEGEGGE